MEPTTIFMIILVIVAAILILKFVKTLIKVFFVIALIAILFFSLFIFITIKDIKDQESSLFEKGKDMVTGLVTKKIKEKTEINSSEIDSKESELIKIIP